MLSDKQEQIVRFAHDDGAISLSVGAVRSGKTYAASTAFLLYTLSLKEPYSHLILGRKLKVMESEIVPHVRGLATALGASSEYLRTHGQLTIGDQTYHLIAANDGRSVDRMQGMTIHSELLDEATLVPEDFFSMALSRLTYEDSKMWSTCNPGSPLHWLKKNWIDEGKIDQHVQFGFDDNPSLTDAVKERNRMLFSGVFEKRMIDGLWAATDGLIYPDWEAADDEGKVIKTTIGVDYGTASPSAFVALQTVRVDGQIRYRVPEVVYVKGGTSEYNKTDSELADILCEFADVVSAGAVVLDPGATSLRAELLKRRKRAFTVRSANNSVIPGIRLTNNVLSKGTVKIDKSGCKDLIDELNTYAWDPTRIDKPIKANDHACDALRYAIMDVLPTTNRPVALPRGM